MEKDVSFIDIKDVFISYKSEDYDVARSVRVYLENLAFKVWMAPEDIPGSSNYAQAIPIGIENCKVFVLILTEKVQTLKWVLRELKRAIEEEKVIVPFMVEECKLNDEFAFMLQGINIIHAYEDMRAALNRLQVMISMQPGIRRLHPVAKKILDNARKNKTMLPDTGPDFYALGIIGEKEQIEYCIENFNKVDMKNPATSMKDKTNAFRLIRWAAGKDDPEAMFLYGKLMVDGLVPTRGGSFKYMGRKYLYEAALEGHEKARKCLDNNCEIEYLKQFVFDKPMPAPAPLRDNDNWRISLKHTRKDMPVSAQLEFNGSINILRLKVRVNASAVEKNSEDEKEFRAVVTAGFQQWEMACSVFGNQTLLVHVDVEFTEDEKTSVCIRPMLAYGQKMKLLPLVTDLTETLAQARAEGRHSVTIFNKKKWSLSGGKTIYLDNSTSDIFDNETIMKAIKYEFGHILGLGDIKNIPKGTYMDLDPYYIDDGVYDLVMCGKDGIISNNDIEMVLLALSEDKLQEYCGENVSKALGRGN